VGFAEIDKFASAVLAERFGSNLPGEPLSRNGVPNFGDFTSIDVTALGPVDLLVGGTPCQAFSFAGRGSRSRTPAAISLSPMRCWHMNLLDLMDSGTPSGKTSPASSRPTTTPSAVSWARLSAQTMPCLSRTESSGGQTQAWFPGHGHGRLGGFSTLNISAWPNDASVCSLSSILETGPIPQRYYLSPKACRGILRRAAKRGKELPELLRLALKAVADSEPISNATEDAGLGRSPIDASRVRAAAGLPRSSLPHSMARQARRRMP
jgi:hypothetical protein